MGYGIELAEDAGHTQEKPAKSNREMARRIIRRGGRAPIPSTTPLLSE